MEYHGPSVKLLKYHAVTPPSTWNGVTRRILPKNHMLNLERNLTLDMSTQTLSVVESESRGKWNFELPISEFSIHVEPPTDGGVVNIYVKGSSKDEWMEFTFDSAHMAAQFQIDLLANQMFGKAVYSLYQALSLVHQGSDAHRGQEFVFHDSKVASAPEQSKDEKNPAPAMQHESSGLAWDDAMRALSTIPTVRRALEVLWEFERRKRSRRGASSNQAAAAAAVGNSTSQASTDPEESLSDEYKGKRLLLGLLDFFRLFVPRLPDAAVPNCESHKTRMEQLLQWRKTVARAAVMINAYRKARCIANTGWVLPPSAEVAERPLKKRLAYDDNAANTTRDLYVENEIYEATVSRDVLCHVRPDNYFQSKDGRGFLPLHKRAKSVMSPYQAYTLVGEQCFRLPDTLTEEDAMHPKNDPVKTIPTLREMIEGNPDVHFLITTYSSEIRQCCMVGVYARSLAKGADPKFDNVMRRFCQGDKEFRDRKVHMMFQLGPTIKESFLAWLVIRILRFLFSLTRKGRESPVSLQRTKGRSPFPALRMMHFCDMHHFGGSLQDDDSLPSNYVAITTVYQSRHMPNLITRLLFSRMERGTIEKNIIDFTWVLEGEQEDELPERALCTLRMVHVRLEDVAHPHTSSALVKIESKDDETDNGQGMFHAINHSKRSGNLISRAFTDVVSRIGHGKVLGVEMELHMDGNATDEDEKQESESFEDALAYVDSKDPYEIAANQMTELLEGIVITSDRSTSLKRGQQSDSTMILSTVNRHDMKRYFAASKFNLKLATMRLVQTAVWRKDTFPVDPRRCRVELQNGQFFHQGRDVHGNLVFYFRNMCLGPWRGDVEAILLSVLLRLDKAINDVLAEEPNIKCTLVAFMGLPYRTKKAKKKKQKKKKAQKGGDDTTSDDAKVADESTDAGKGGDDVSAAATDDGSPILEEGSDNIYLNNPRIDAAETWHVHTNKDVLFRLFDVLERHYPERLAKVFVVPGRGRNDYYDVNFGGRSKLAAFFTSRTMTKVHFLKRDLSKLSAAIPRKSLLKMVGGDADIGVDAFQAGL
eukprot:CAMPEP_0119560458 /NCGR_PEP_ID=MMETSP1352-20130426/14914_1 /TAXON_ID=265584 /ORGANISM="Stauroneis constricta, Strain CCMP1120" /LENGTH=1045 /DNA_ID=CAMNT_0007608439 /DNA_START=70 /DNA_END=3207 /DNA_ORIENTATION=-